MEPLTIGFISLGLFLVLILTGLPVGVTALLVSIVGMYFITGFDQMTSFIGYMPFGLTSLYGLSVIPLFIIMGYFIFHSGFVRDLFFTARQWLGHFPGGLAMATAFGNAGFGAVSGSSLAAASVFGKTAVPELRKYGYDPKLATGIVAASGTMSVMIPPSVILVMYGILAEQSVATLFIAGIIPGILEAISYALVVWGRCTINPKLGPKMPKASWKERIISLKGIWGVVLLIVIVLGGLFMGFFTPTEAGGIGAMGALLIGLFSKRLNWSGVRTSLMDAVRTCAMLFILLAGILMFMRLLAFSGVTAAITSSIAELPLPPVAVLIALLVVSLIYGFFLSAVGLLAIVVPIFLPALTAMGISPIVFAILLVRVIECGQITPPVGIVVYAVKAVVPDVPLEDIFKGILPFFYADLANIALMIAFPAIILFLPNLM